MKIFVTGGAGFIASHLVGSLLPRHSVVIYDNYTRDAMRFAPFRHSPRLQVVRGDVLDRERLKAAMKGSEVVIHCAAIAGVSHVGKDTNTTIKVNLIGSYNALEAAVANRVRRFINFSTSEIYGPFVYRAREDGFSMIGEVGERRWTYAASKMAAEHLAHTYISAHGLEVVTVRPFNVYGPRQVGEGAIHSMAMAALRNKPITVYDDGAQIRAWCFINDFVRACVPLATGRKHSGEVFNIGNPRATVTVLGLAETIVELTRSRSTIHFEPHPGPEIHMRVPDVTKAGRLLNFHPRVDLKEGLRLSIAWYRKHRKSL